MATHRHWITGPLRTITCLAAGILLAMLFGADSREPAALQPLDAAAQRLRIEQELAAMNEKMDRLLGLLQSGNLKVVCVRADTDGRGPEHDARTPAPVWTPPASPPAPASLHAR